jgi:hypothetical protein
MYVTMNDIQRGNREGWVRWGGVGRGGNVKVFENIKGWIHGVEDIPRYSRSPKDASLA